MRKKWIFKASIIFNKRSKEEKAGPIRGALIRLMNRIRILDMGLL